RHGDDAFVRAKHGPHAWGRIESAVDPRFPGDRYTCRAARHHSRWEHVARQPEGRPRDVRRGAGARRRFLLARMADDGRRHLPHERIRDSIRRHPLRNADLPARTHAQLSSGTCELRGTTMQGKWKSTGIAAANLAVSLER